MKKVLFTLLALVMTMGMQAQQIHIYKTVDGVKTRVTSYTNDATTKFSAVLTEVNTILTTGVTLDKTAVSLETEKSITLTATIAPEDATDKAVVWTSSNTDVATVSDGVVTATQTEGTAIITAASHDGNGISATCTVTVKKHVSVTGVTMSPTSVMLYMSGTKTASLTATVLPESASNKNVIWSSSNTGVATVDESGTVTAVAAGTATITVTTSEGSMKAYAEVTVLSSSNHEYVDLGLPSGTKWATCNIGADNPEDCGIYFAWGETTGCNNTGTCSMHTFSWPYYKWCNGTETTMTKYCTSSSSGTVDNKTKLESADDAATANWGSDWCMPTNAQILELFNSTYTTNTWTTQNGVNGWLITSKMSGHTDKSIFLPAAGYRSSIYRYSSNGAGYYWSSELRSNDSPRALNVRFTSNSNYVTTNTYSVRYFGFSVRPVRR